MFNESVIVKQSPIVIIKNFILFELAAMAVFFVVSALANYAAIYRSLFASQPIPFQMAELLFIVTVQTILIFYIFLRWYKDYYDISPTGISHGWGIVFRHQEVITLHSFNNISYHQGPLGKILKYGTIDLVGAKIRKMHNIPEPRKHGELIMRLHGSILDQKSPLGGHTIDQLIDKAENDRLEFKSSFRWDVNEKKVNKGLEKSAMKTVAAFLNSNGGHLLLGVDDKKNVIGISGDYHTLPRPDMDSFENHFTQVFHTMIGPEYRQFVDLVPHKVGGKDVCLIKVNPSRKPVYLRTDGNEEFFIRTGNKTTPLKFSEASAYIDSHWHNRLT